MNKLLRGDREGPIQTCNACTCASWAHCDGCLYCLSLWWQQATSDETPPIMVAHRLDTRTHPGHRGCRQHGEKRALRDALSLRCHFDARSSRHSFTAGLYNTYNDPNTSLNSPRYCTTRTSDIWVMSVPMSRATAATGMHSGSGSWTPTSRPCSATSASRCSLRILVWKRFCSHESSLRSQRRFLLTSFPSSSNSAWKRITYDHLLQWVLLHCGCRTGRHEGRTLRSARDVPPPQACRPSRC